MRDPNYVIDPRGKAHYVFGTKSREALANGDHPLSTTKRNNSAARKRARDETSSEVEESVSEESSSSIAPHSALSSSAVDLESDEEFAPTSCPAPISRHLNPLPGFIDVITRQEVERPMISPYGHVLSYDTWLRCLFNGERKNVCPFTKQPLHKRQLVLLTEENIAHYENVIQQNL